MNVKKYSSSITIARSDYSDEELIEQLLTDFSHQVRMGALPTLLEYEGKLRKELKKTASLSRHISYFHHQISNWIWHAYDNGQITEQVLDLYGQSRHPKTIDRYRVISLVGQGATSNVYSAEDSARGIEVCIKLEKKEAVGKTDFAREAKINNSLDHPQIVRIDNFGVHDGLQFMVSRIAPGVPLSEVSFGDAGDTAMFLAEVCKPLIHAHDSGVCHNDLKPENIYVDGEGVPRILDFGGAEAWHLSLSDPKTVTQFTPAYASPEQRKNQPVDKRSDIYSLGVIFFQMLTGELPEKTTDPGKLNPSISKRISKTCQWMLMESLSERMNDLRRFEASVNPPDRRFAFALTISAVIILLAVSIWLASMFFNRFSGIESLRNPNEKLCSIDVPIKTSSLYVFPLVKGEPDLVHGRELEIGEAFRLEPGEYEFSVVSRDNHIQVMRTVPSSTDSIPMLNKCQSFSFEGNKVVLPSVVFANPDLETLEVGGLIYASEPIESNVNWYEAKSIAERLGMHLPSIEALEDFHKSVNSNGKMEWSRTVKLISSGVPLVEIYGSNVAQAAVVGSKQIYVRPVRTKLPLVPR